MAIKPRSLNADRMTQPDDGTPIRTDEYGKPRVIPAVPGEQKPPRYDVVLASIDGHLKVIASALTRIADHVAPVANPEVPYTTTLPVLGVDDDAMIRAARNMLLPPDVPVPPVDQQDPPA